MSRRHYKIIASTFFVLNIQFLLAGERVNPYSLSDAELEASIQAGVEHALVYPVSTTQLLVPYNPFKNFISAENTNPLKKIFLGISEKVFQIKDMQTFYKWLGLAPFNEAANARGIYDIPRPKSYEADQPMGVTLLQSKGATGLSFSCASCHAGELLGRSVFGLPNKGIRANRVFVIAKKALPLMPSVLFQAVTHATNREREMLHNSKAAMDSVQPDNPLVLGLDTSLAHVGRSLATRHEDSVASKSFFYERFPRSHQLDKSVADSKIGTWWLVKYKNKFLSDGSTSGGNPIVMNILWNEIGRGSDLQELEDWFDKNPKTIRDLTNAVYNVQAPRWTDFFLASSVNITNAQKGEVLFNNNCAKCHGVYEKAWSDTSSVADIDALKTTRIRYFKETPVIDVGTDSNRRVGMRELSGQLNRLRIYEKNKLVGQETKGYVPPPLEGIWARYPYFHNNSAPSLCAVLSLEALRPKEYYQGPSKSVADFDEECVGYPVGNKIPASWKQNPGLRYDVTRVGLSNKGHTSMLLNADGSERYTAQDKKNIIEYLKTL